MSKVISFNFSTGLSPVEARLNGTNIGFLPAKARLGIATIFERLRVENAAVYQKASAMENFTLKITPIPASENCAIQILSKQHLILAELKPETGFALLSSVNVLPPEFTTYFRSGQVSAPSPHDSSFLTSLSSFFSSIFSTIGNWITALKNKFSRKENIPPAPIKADPIIAQPSLPIAGAAPQDPRKAVAFDPALPLEQPSRAQLREPPAPRTLDDSGSESGDEEFLDEVDPEIFNAQSSASGSPHQIVSDDETSDTDDDTQYFDALPDEPLEIPVQVVPAQTREIAVVQDSDDDLSSAADSDGENDVFYDFEETTSSIPASASPSSTAPSILISKDDPANAAAAPHPILQAVVVPPPQPGAAVEKIDEFSTIERPAAAAKATPRRKIDPESPEGFLRGYIENSLNMLLVKLPSKKTVEFGNYFTNRVLDLDNALPVTCKKIKNGEEYTIRYAQERVINITELPYNLSKHITAKVTFGKEIKITRKDGSRKLEFDSNSINFTISYLGISYSIPLEFLTIDENFEFIDAKLGFSFLFRNTVISVINKFLPTTQQIKNPLPLTGQTIVDAVEAHFPKRA